MVAPILKEYYVVATMALIRMALGFAVAYPSILNPVITSNNTDIHATSEEASWIASSYSLSGSIGYLILPGVMQLYGRKVFNIVLNLCILLGYMIIALAPNVSTIITGRSVQGLAYCGLYLNSVIIAEYCHPKRRGYLMILKSATMQIGILLCHGLGFTLTWRQMAWLGAVPSSISIICTFTWPESPSWLAYKGHFEECIQSFEWLRGKNINNNEVRELIVAQREIRKMRRNQGNLFKITIKSFCSRDFLKPLSIIFAIELLSHVCGLYYSLIFIVHIMKQLSGDESKSFYYTLAVDILNIFSIIPATIVAKFLNRRTVLIYFGSLSCIILSCVCVVDYLERAGIITFKWITPLILIVFFFVSHVGVMPLFVLLAGEIFPLEHKSTGSSVLGIMNAILCFVILKYFLNMMEVIKIYGTFAVYLILAVLCVIYLYYILPETKDRTLQNIELDFINIPLKDIKKDGGDEEIITKLMK